MKTPHLLPLNIKNKTGNNISPSSKTCRNSVIKIRLKVLWSELITRNISFQDIFWEITKVFKYVVPENLWLALWLWSFLLAVFFLFWVNRFGKTFSLSESFTYFVLGQNSNKVIMKGVNKTNKNFKIEMFSLHPARS